MEISDLVMMFATIFLGTILGNFVWTYLIHPTKEPISFEPHPYSWTCGEKDCHFKVDGTEEYAIRVIAGNHMDNFHG